MKNSKTKLSVFTKFKHDKRVTVWHHMIRLKQWLPLKNHLFLKRFLTEGEGVKTAQNGYETGAHGGCAIYFNNELKIDAFRNRMVHSIRFYYLFIYTRITKILTTFAKNVLLLLSLGVNVYRRMSSSVCKLKITSAGGAICFGLPKMSAKPVSITHKRLHSSTRIRNVDIIDELSASGPLTASASLAAARPAAKSCPLDPIDSIVFACQFGYGYKIGLDTFASLPSFM